MAESDVGEIFLPGRSAKLAFSELPCAVVDLRHGWDLGPGLGGQATGVLEDVTCRASRVGDRITAESKAFTWIKNEREARLQGIKTAELLLCCLSMANEGGVHFLHEHPWGASSWDLDCMKAVRELPSVVVVRCDERLYGLVDRWLLKEGGWGERPSTQRTGWMTSMTDLARELIVVQGLAQGREMEKRAPPCLIIHATERYPSRLVEAIWRCLSTHLRRKFGVPLDAVQVGIGPHVDDDVQRC